MGAPVGRAFLFSVALEATVVADATVVGRGSGGSVEGWLWPLVEVFLGLGWLYSLVEVWPGCVARVRVGLPGPGPGRGLGRLC